MKFGSGIFDSEAGGSKVFDCETDWIERAQLLFRSTRFVRQIREMLFLEIMTNGCFHLFLYLIKRLGEGALQMFILYS